MLRGAGVACTTSEVMDAVRALELVDLLDRDEVHRALRTVLVTRREEIPIFDRCFDAFWTLPRRRGAGARGIDPGHRATQPEDDTHRGLGGEPQQEGDAGRAGRVGGGGGGRRRAARGAGGERPGGPDGSGLLQLPLGSARRGGPHHRAHRQAAGPALVPAPAAGAAGRRGRPPPEHPRQHDEGRDHRAAGGASGGGRRSVSCCSATSRARWTSTAASSSCSSTRCRTPSAGWRPSPSPRD